MIELTREVLDDFVAFIRARLHDMEQRALAVTDLISGFDRPAAPGRAPLSPEREFAAHHGPQQDLADAAATRRLLEHLLFGAELWFPVVGREAQAVLIVASRWISHPDYALLLERHARPAGNRETPP